MYIKTPLSDENHILMEGPTVAMFYEATLNNEFSQDTLY